MGAIGPEAFIYEANRLLSVNTPDATFAATINALAAKAGLYLFDGVAFRRQETNSASRTLLASANRTTSVTSAVQTNYFHKGVALLLDITTGVAGETLTLRLRMGLTTGIFVFDFPASAAGAAGPHLFYVYPGAVETNATAKFEVQGVPLLREWTAGVQHSGAGSWTYSLEAFDLL